MLSAERRALIDHLKTHALRIDGPFTLRSGETSDWYVDARQTTFDGIGARLVGTAVTGVLPEGVTAVGGLTMGADPIAVATVIASPHLKAFSIRKEAKHHGTGGRLVGPVRRGDRAVVLEDTTTTGAAMIEAVDVLTAAGVTVVGAVALVDRSGGRAGERLAGKGVPLVVLVTPTELGVA